MSHSHGLLVTKANVATERDNATIVSHVTDTEGQAVLERVVEAMRWEIGFNIYQVKNALGLIPTPASSPQFFLHLICEHDSVALRAVLVYFGARQQPLGCLRAISGLAPQYGWLRVVGGTYFPGREEFVSNGMVIDDHRIMTRYDN